MEALVITELDLNFKYSFYHRENQQWLHSLAFYKEELTYFVGLFDTIEASEESVIFENKLKTLKDEVENILDMITKEEWAFEDDAEGRDFLLGEEIYERHHTIRDHYQQLEKDYLVAKHDLYHFLSKVLK